MLLLRASIRCSNSMLPLLIEPSSSSENDESNEDVDVPRSNILLAELPDALESTAVAPMAAAVLLPLP